MYRCRVDFKYAQTRNSKVNLTIIVPPNKILIRNETGHVQTAVVGPYSENSDLTLFCQVFNGKPKPNIMWYKNGQLLSNVTVNATSKYDVSYYESVITVRRLQRSDLKSNLTCAASNYYLEKAITTSVEVDMNFGPLDVRIMAEEQPLTANRPFELICQSTGSRPPPKLTWWKDGVRIHNCSRPVPSDGNVNISASILTYTPQKDDAGKFLSCRSENDNLRGSKMLETGWKLQIHYMPEVRIKLGTNLKKDSIKEGMDVYFDCDITAHPAAYKIDWRKNNKPLLQSKGVIISNRSLVLQGVSRNSAGNYSCIGYNSEGDGISDPFNLNVMYAPFCKPNQTRVYGIAKNELVNISCEVEANPAELTFRWKFNNSAENDELAPVISKPGATISVISHMPVLEVDYGTLLCSATNKVGRQKVPCVFHVIAAGRPDPVSNCSVNNISLNSFSVRCVEGFNGGLPQTFSISVTEQHDSQMVNMTSTSPSFTVSGLQPGTSYSVSVHSINAKGHSEPYQLEVLTQGKRISQMNGNIGEIPPEKQQGNFHVTATMSIIIGAVISLLTIVCIVASVFKIQCSKSRSNAKSRNQKRHGSNGNLAAADKNFSSPIHSDEVSASVCPSIDIDSDDKNPDIIPQPVTADIDRLSDSSRKKQHISTIENRYMQNRNFLQFSNTPTSYSGYCTLRTGIVPLQDFCHLNTKTTSIHGDLQYLSSSSGTLNRHQWPTYSGTIAGVQSHQCAYQVLPNPTTHQQAQTQTPIPPSMIETSLPNTSLAINKQESTV